MIREARSGDIDQLLELFMIWYSESGTAFDEVGFDLDLIKMGQSLYDFIHSKDFILLVYEKRDLLGVIGAAIFSSPFNGKKVLQEIFWYVHPHHRNHGVMLLKALAKKGRENSCQLMIFSTSKNTKEEKLMRIYKKLGFKYLETNFVKEL